MSWPKSSGIPELDQLKERLARCSAAAQTAHAENERLREALETVADIAEGSETVNSLPHIARIARAALQQ